MDISSQKRGKTVAVMGLVFQIAVAFAMLIVWVRTDSLSAMAATWLLVGGIPLWIIATVLFYCRQLQIQETLELEEIAAHAAAGTIFDRENQASLRPAAARLTWMLRWIVPVFTLLFAAYNIAIGAVVLRYLGRDLYSSLPNMGLDALTQSLIFCVLTGFLGLLLSRYSTGVGSQETYRPLRSPGSYLLINVLAVIGVIACLAFAYNGNIRVDAVVAYVIPLAQLVLAAELLLNFIMDIYRPRVPGQEQRLAFDSRLFNLLADPGRVGHSVAEALNYQFGFEVSKTWFYQLLARAMLPMLVVAVLILLAMTSIVIIPSGEQAVIFHQGKIQRLVGAGEYLKWPWPIDKVERFDVDAVRDMYLGAGNARSSAEFKATVIDGREVNLWTQEHGYLKENDFLVAAPPPKAGGETSKAVQGKAPAVNIIKLVVLVQYRIKDVLKYIKYDQPVQQLECRAYREMVSYLASATLLDRVDNSDRPQAIMTSGRQAAANELKRRIKDAVEKDLGVEIMYVGFQGVHPPSESGTNNMQPEGPGSEKLTCAKAYEQVMEAQRRQEETRYEAEATANRILAKVAGSPAQALKLALAIQTQSQLESLKDQYLPDRLDEAIAEAKRKLRTLDEEIDWDRLLGKVSSPQPATGNGADGETASDTGIAMTFADKLALREQYLQYIQTLEDVKAHPAQKLPGALAKATADVEELFKNAGGQPASLVAQAQAQRWSIELAERAKSESFQRESQAYKLAPNIYMLDRWLDAYDEVLPRQNKYVFALDRNKIDLRVDLRTESEPMGGGMEPPPGK